ncbi:hypothetical protein FGO68_gene14696 [Halteria grandinella]|uniref:Uncharacterized protein n=1 Tax=Halteria grandinella TaxID=5974 RepID=A0A8J8SWY2_HALGN|nr:hypothetical protein FGO68_gene14696 [Halteria grandinella]
MRYQLGRQEAQINAFASLVGNLAGASHLISLCFDSQSKTPLNELREELNENQNRVNMDLKTMVDQRLKSMEEMMTSEIQRMTQKGEQQKQSLENQLNSFEQLTQSKQKHFQKNTPSTLIVQTKNCRIQVFLQKKEMRLHKELNDQLSSGVSVAKANMRELVLLPKWVEEAQLQISYMQSVLGDACCWEC